METVLLIEDHANLATLYKQELEGDGYRVILAGDNEEGYQRFINEHPDIAVVDIMLPSGNGIELAERMAMTEPNIPIILNTAYGQFRQDFRTWVADAYVVKSSDLSELKKTIIQVLQATCDSTTTREHLRRG